MEFMDEKEASKKSLSDDVLDAVAGVILIGVTVTALVFWLSDMPY